MGPAVPDPERAQGRVHHPVEGSPDLGRELRWHHVRPARNVVLGVVPEGVSPPDEERLHAALGPDEESLCEEAGTEGGLDLPQGLEHPDAPATRASPGLEHEGQAETIDQVLGPCPSTDCHEGSAGDPCPGQGALHGELVAAQPLPGRARAGDAQRLPDRPRKGDPGLGHREDDRGVEVGGEGPGSLQRRLPAPGGRNVGEPQRRRGPARVHHQAPQPPPARRLDGGAPVPEEHHHGCGRGGGPGPRGAVQSSSSSKASQKSSGRSISMACSPKVALASSSSSGISTRVTTPRKVVPHSSGSGAQ